MTEPGNEVGRPIAALERLPRRMEPARDLWPDIQARLESRTAEPGAPRRPWALPAVAAAVAVAFLAGILLGRQGVPGPASPGAVEPAMTLADAAAPSVAAALEATEREYRAAYKGFDTVGLAPSVLAPQTVERLGDSWQAMKQAETALKTALEEHPDNPFLAQKLLDLRAQQLDFMRQLHMLDQNSRRST